MTSVGFFGRMKKIFIWILLSVATGAVTGFVGAVFHHLISDVTSLRKGNDWLIFLLPLAAVIITFIYSFSKEKLTTDTVFSGIREKREISPLLAPFIFISSIISHLVGASVGREGAALQIGGGIGSGIGHMLKVGDNERGRLLVLGMSGAFAAIFMTPVTAAFFAIEVLTVGHMRYYRIFYCMISSLTAFAISLAMGNARTEFPDVNVLGFDLDTVLKCALLALVSGFIAHLFCHVIHVTETYSEKILKTNIFVLQCWLRLFCLLRLYQEQECTTVREWM